jgi:protein-L-isoaspartate(D-aspartate) O-methyltransferase
MKSLLNQPIEYPNEAYSDAQGVGMTSQRTRNRLVERLMALGITDEAVLNAIRVTPRHLFIDEAMASRAYEDTALPIGHGQTISQPWVVAKMTSWLLADGPLHKVLDVGTGSGYQAAILALLVDEVYSVERIEPLLLRAQQVLKQLRLNNVHANVADGFWGIPSEAPFDGIVCAASPESVPQELLDQLRIGGRLVMPIGGTEQGLFGFVKTETGYTEDYLGPVMFVPMLSGIET